MATSSKTKSTRSEIEFLFHKILSPIKKTADPNLIFQFCQQLNDIEDAQHAADLIVNKILSTQDWEVLIALYVLEACVKNCGEPMHEIIGRFRFLNEMIKLISPKYFGNRTSEQCKKKCIELIFCWARDLPQKPKIKEAYAMIKKQGLVKEDPTDVEELKINVTPRQKDPIFEDEEKAKQLARLLKSRNPQDLEMANKLIKNMVKQDEIKAEKTSARINELEKINTNIKLLTEMLSEFDAKNAKSSEKETIKYLYEELERFQPTLVKLAVELDENDESIGEILKTNDDCETIMKKYKSVFDHTFSPDDALVNLNPLNDERASGKPTQPAAPAGTNLVDDFLNFTSPSIPDSAHSTASTTTANNTEVKSSSNKDLEDLFSGTNLDELYKASSQQQQQQSQQSLMMPMNQNASAPNIFDAKIPPAQNFLIPQNPTQSHSKSNNASDMFMMSTSASLNSINQPAATLQPTVAKTDSNNSLKNTTNLPTVAKTNKPFDDLSELSKALMGDSLNFTPTSELQAIKAQKMNDMIKSASTANTNGQQQNNIENNRPTSNDSASVFESMNSIFVELESIKPSVSIPPLNLYDKNNLKIVLHFARDQPAKFINTIVISTSSSNMQSEIKNFLFQAAVTKNMKVKLQPASRSDLPVFNPILPLTAITQIMLIANPNQEQVRIKYKLSYTLNGQEFVENDEVKNFPQLTW